MLKIPEPKSIYDFNILIIDAQMLVHDVIKSALADMGIKNVKSAENAYYALRLCEKTHFDIVMIAFDVKSDKDGFHLLEEMKFKGFIQKSTSVVFLSADTTSELVNCVIELQPSDFWVKPLDRMRVQQRMKHITEIRDKLYRLRYCMDKGEYATVIYMAERQLLDASLEKYFPQINRMIGESLFNLFEFSQAQEFYEKLSETCNYGWVKVGLVRSLLKQGNIEQALPLANDLIERGDTRFATYDALAEYYIEQEDYKKGYEIIQKATALAPRNIERNKKSWNLARLNHDRVGQYRATRNIANYAKNSIHDSPELTLNVLRSGIDLAVTLSDEESNKLLMRVETDIIAMNDKHSGNEEIREQLDVIKARLLSARKNKKEAEEVMKPHLRDDSTATMEANLDKVKAFHEMGYREESIKLLNKIKSEIESDSFSGQVINEYLSQEQDERENIHYTPKELSEMASNHYGMKRYRPAMELLAQALKLNPQNNSVAISLLKVAAILSEEEEGLQEQEQKVVDSCFAQLSEAKLSDAQRQKFDEYTGRINASNSGAAA